jgi:hypothetical protein
MPSLAMTIELTMNSPQFYIVLPPIRCPAISNCTTAQQNFLVADLAATKAARQGAVQGSTHVNQAQAWQRWNEYCESIGLTDVYLDNFLHNQQTKLMGAFAMACAKDNFWKIMAFWLKAQSEVPSCMWFRLQGE